MPALRPVELLQALNIEGDVTVFLPEGRSCYYVFFRHNGRQISRSTGKKKLAEAKIEAGRIFASVLCPQSVGTLNEVLETVKRLEANLAVGSPAPSDATPAHQRVHPKPLDKALELFLEEKRKKAWHTWSTLRIRITNFVAFCTAQNISLVHEVTAPTCYEWAKAQEVSSKTRNK